MFTPPKKRILDTQKVRSIPVTCIRHLLLKMLQTLKHFLFLLQRLLFSSLRLHFLALRLLFLALRLLFSLLLVNDWVSVKVQVAFCAGACCVSALCVSIWVNQRAV